MRGTVAMQLVLLQLKAVQTDAASKIEIQLKLFPRCTSLGQIASKEKTTVDAWVYCSSS